MIIIHAVDNLMKLATVLYSAINVHLFTNFHISFPSHFLILIFILYLNTIKFKVNNVCNTADTCSRSIANMKCDLLHMYPAVNRI